MGIGRVNGVSKGCNVKRIPEKWSPDFWRYMHPARTTVVGLYSGASRRCKA